MACGLLYQNIINLIVTRRIHTMQLKHTVVLLAVIVSLIPVLSLGVFTGMNAHAEEERPTASADVGILSKYVWRGEELSKDSIIVQPSVTVGYRGVSVNLWGNLDTDVYDGAYTDKAKWTETDFTLGYDRSFGLVGVGLGYIYYALDGAVDSQEFYVSLGLDTIAAPTLTIYKEVTGALKGWYATLQVSHSFELPKEISLDLAASAGYYYSDNESYVEYTDGLAATAEPFRDFKDGLISVGLTIPIDRYISIIPVIAYSFPLTDRADNFIAGSSTKSDHSDFFYGGITLSMSF